MKCYVKLALIVAGSLSAVLLLASVVYGAPPASDPVTVNVTVDNFISISNPGDVTLVATIAGTGGSSENSTMWTVATNNDLGYKLEASATGAPAMTKGADSFADYVNGAPVPWAVAAADSAFGFSAEGSATPVGTWGTPGVGSGNYRGFSGATAIEVANNGNETAGENTTLYFKAEVGATHLQASGLYSANLTITATAL